jgi:hypothetical protein
MSNRPKLVIVISNKGIESSRIVANSIKEERDGEALLERISTPLMLINNLCDKRPKCADEACTLNK